MTCVKKVVTISQDWTHEDKTSSILQCFTSFKRHFYKNTWEKIHFLLQNAAAALSQESSRTCIYVGKCVIKHNSYSQSKFTCLFPFWGTFWRVHSQLVGESQRAPNEIVIAAESCPDSGSETFASCIYFSPTACWFSHVKETLSHTLSPKNVVYISVTQSRRG